MIFQLIRFLLVIAGTVAGVSLGYGLCDEYPGFFDTTVNREVKLAALLGCIGYLLCSMAGRELQQWLESRFEKVNSQELVWSGLGFLVGLIGANFLFFSLYFVLFSGMGEFRFQNHYLNAIRQLVFLMVPLIINLLGGWLGSLVLFKYRQAQNRPEGATTLIGGKLFDTSALVDGRVADLIRLGFLEGRILVPRFVVNELQFIADSNDMARRNKGRHGLEVLNQLVRGLPDRVTLSEHDPKDVQQVDSKLVEVAKSEKLTLVTTDFNLKRVAELQGVPVLNLTDLGNALKPIAVSGEVFSVKIIKLGKEPGQGVGYLDDGTMIVIEEAADQIGRACEVLVTNILQTSAGRLIFARLPKKAERAEQNVQKTGG